MRWCIGSLALLLGALGVTDASSLEAVPPGYRLVAAEAGVPPALFYAVALAESGKRFDVGPRPWPWTLNVAGEGRFYPSREAASRALAAALATGMRSIDIGLMQVNWRYHGEKLESAALALDPYHNLRVGARILRRCFEERGAWSAAVGCYHAPADDARASRYLERVRGVLRSLGASVEEQAG